MFSKGDPSSNLKRLQVTVKTRSGETEQGAILIPAHHTLRQALNDEGPFIEFERIDGRRAFLLKTEIARIDSQNSSEPQPDESSVHEWSRFDAADARLVLGVGAEVTREELHDVWVDLVKAYHPDRLASLGLPQEILRHADRVLARINAAYKRLNDDAAAGTA